MMRAASFIIVMMPILLPQQDEVRWLNPTSSPISFDAKPKTRIAGITSKSRAEVVAFRLGCLKMQDERLQVLARYKLIEEIHLTPTRMGMIVYDTLQQEWHDCKAKTGSLSAVEVRFADGSFWQAAPMPKKEEPK